MKRAHWPWVLIAISLSTAAVTAFLTHGSGAKAKPEPRTGADASPPAAEASAAVKPTDPPADDDVPAASQAAKTGIDERGHLLETVGCLTSAHYFQTYLNIGFIADAKAKGTNADRDARWALDSVLSLLRSTDEKVEALDKFELDREDRERLGQLRAVSALLRQQAKELQAYWDGGKEENATKYESLRQSSWASLSKLMGIGP